MDVNQEQSGPEEQSRDVDRVSPLPVDLCEMLREEWFLRMVLERVSQFELEACRLVCRQWHATCQELPYNLTIHRQELEQALAAFPNATSVTMISYSKLVKDADFFSLLFNAHELRSLALSVGALELTDCVRYSFRLVQNLTELTLHLSDVPEATTLLDSVRNLTGLTRLDLISLGQRPRPVEPFVELKAIRSLAVNPSLFADANETCLFPSLTNLTSLQVGSHWNVLASEANLSLKVRRFVSESMHV